MSFGSADAISLSKARDGERDVQGNITSTGAKDPHATVRLGGDPAGETKQAKRSASKTFEALAGEFLKQKKADLKPRSYVDVERHIRKCSASLQPLQVSKTTRTDIKECLRTVAETRGAIIARDGHTIRTKSGLKDHPLLKHELAARSFIVRSLHRLGLDIEPTRSSVGRPPGPSIQEVTPCRP